jgi:ABC-type antimicrobial peptide transport system permease subunit
MGLWLLDVKKHIPEFAVRIAIGSTRKELGKMVFIQNLVISLIAAIPGLILAFFIYEFRMIEIMGIGASLLVMLLFSVFSACYPAYMAFKINPAEALQYE